MSKNSSTSATVTDPAQMNAELVLITHVADDKYERIYDLAKRHPGGTVVGAIEHLAQWDTGDEHDAATGTNGTTALDALLALPSYSVFDHQYGGLRYWLCVDHYLRSYSLYRCFLPARA